MSKSKAEVDQILKDYSNDPKAIQEAIYAYMRENKIPFIKPLESGLFELYDGKSIKIVEESVINKIKKQQLEPEVKEENQGTIKTDEGFKEFIKHKNEENEAFPEGLV